jgi:hypothetical protein
MKIYVNWWLPNDPTITTRKKITITLDVEPTSTFAEIKAQIHNVHGIVPEEQCLMCHHSSSSSRRRRRGDEEKLKEVEDECTLSDYNLQMESCLQMLVKNKDMTHFPEKWNTSMGSSSLFLEK